MLDKPVNRDLKGKSLSGTINENKFIQQYGLYILISLIAVIVFIVFYDFIVFRKLYLFKGLASDSLNDTYPNYILVSDYLRSDGIPRWSFRQGMGQNVFPFSFPDPFVSILYLLGRVNLAYGIAYMEIVKIFLAGILFYLFLKKRGISEYAAILGGLFYCFSGFMIIGSCWNLFSTEVVYLAFLLLAFEKLYQEDNRILFPITVALIAILQPFDLWLFGVFLLIYIIVRHFEEHERAYRKFFGLLLRTWLLALLGVGIASFIFLSEVRIMLNSPRVAGSAGLYDVLISKSPLVFESELHYLTVVMRLFSSYLLGASNFYGGWNNFMEAPLLYCGLINLLLVPQLFQFFDKRRKQIYAVTLIVIVLPIIFPLLRYSLWLFTGNYYRVYGFFVSILLMFMGMQSIHLMFRYKKIDRKLLIITLIVLLSVLFYPWEYLQQHDILNENLRNMVAIVLISYTALIFFLPKFKKLIYLQALLLLMIGIELTSFSKAGVDERMALTNKEYKQKKGYWDYTNEAVSILNKADKGFFRVTKNYHSGPAFFASLNDAKIQRYRGTGSYHSFNHLHYVRFLAGMNLLDEHDEEQTRYITGLRYTPFLHSLFSFKYFLSKGPKPFKSPLYDSLAMTGDVKIYRNKYALPLGFAYDRFISKRDFNTLSPRRKQVALYQAFILNDTIYKDCSKELPSVSLKSIPRTYPQTELTEAINRLRKDTLAISKFSSNRIKGTISLNEKKMLFLSIPYSPGWTAVVDGKKQQLLRINIGFLGLLLDKGEHRVELSFTPPLFYSGLMISIVSILLFIALIILQRRRKLFQTGSQEEESPLSFWITTKSEEAKFKK